MKNYLLNFHLFNASTADTTDLSFGAGATFTILSFVFAYLALYMGVALILQFYETVIEEPITRIRIKLKNRNLPDDKKLKYPSYHIVTFGGLIVYAFLLIVEYELIDFVIQTNVVGRALSIFS